MMPAFEYRQTKNGLSYYLSNHQPQLLIVSGTHGDEYRVIDSVIEVVNRYQTQLPPFLFIPYLSPSAVTQKTRRNVDGMDLNRAFYLPAICDEAMDLIELVKDYKFDTYVSFHEDVHEEGFYFYDTLDLRHSPVLQSVQDQVQALGVPLFSGIDDPADEHLGAQIENGYTYLDITKRDPTFGYWMSKEGIIQRIIELEVPTNLPKAKKTELVEVVMQTLVLP